MVIDITIIMLFHFLYLYLFTKGIRYYHEKEVDFLMPHRNYDRITPYDERLKSGNILFIGTGILCLLLVYGLYFLFPSWFSVVENINSGELSLYYEYFIQVGLLEELIKYIVFILTFMLFITHKGRIFTTPSINYSVDAVFKYFAAIGVALSFATVENISYLISDMTDLESLFVRGTLPTIAHIICGSFMGLFFISGGNEQYSRSKRWGYHILALLVPVLIHGFYNILIYRIESNIEVYMFLLILLIGNIPLLKKNKIIK